MDYPVDISILIPSYNERESLPELLSWIHRTLDPDNKSYEIIIIDDGSDDGTWEAVKELAAADGSNLRLPSFWLAEKPADTQETSPRFG